MTNTVDPTGPRPEPQVRSFSLAKLSPRARERVLRGFRNAFRNASKYAINGRVIVDGVEYVVDGLTVDGVVYQDNRATITAGRMTNNDVAYDVAYEGNLATITAGKGRR